MRELANQAINLDSLCDHRVASLADRLAGAPGWAQRFALLDELLLGWAADGPDADPTVAWAWRRLERSHGLIPVGVLAQETGWSRRHFVSRFAEQVGLPPAGRPPSALRQEDQDLPIIP